MTRSVYLVSCVECGGQTSKKYAPPDWGMQGGVIDSPYPAPWGWESWVLCIAVQVSHRQREELVRAIDAFGCDLLATCSAENTCGVADKTLDSTCPRCGHIHEGLQECGVRIGPNHVCRCEYEVH